MKCFRLFVLILVIFTGCTDDKGGESPTGIENELNTVSIYGVSSSITGIVGEEVNEEFTVSVRNSKGEPVAGAEVNFFVTGINGSIEKLSNSTSQDGFLKAMLRFIIPENTARISIEADTDFGNVEHKTNVIGVNNPDKFEISTVSDVIRIAGGENVELPVDVVLADNNGVGIPYVKLRYGLMPSVEDSSIFGTVSGRGLTDMRGAHPITFKSLGGFGSQIIFCEIVDLVGLVGIWREELQFTIEPLEQTVAEIELVTEEEIMIVERGQVRERQVYAGVKDDDDMPVSNLPIEFSTDLGVIEPLAVTNGLGIAEVTFATTGEYGIAVLSANVPGSEISAETQIIIQSEFGENPTMELFHHREYIYADNGLTTDTVTATLKNGHGETLEGITLRFSSTHGVIAPAVITTDRFGSASAVFKDIGSPSLDEFGQIIPAVITVTAPQVGIKEETEITIREFNPVESIVLQSMDQTLTAGSDDSTLITAICYLRNGSYAPVGTVVEFAAENGTFNTSTKEIDNNSGRSAVWYYPGTTAELTRIRATVDNGEHDEASGVTDITIKAGAPDTVSGEWEGDELRIGDPDSHVSMTWTVTDAYGNPVEGIPVYFSTTLGMLERSHATTDENGRAGMLLFPGTEAGVATFTITILFDEEDPILGTATFPIYGAKVHSITLTADPLNIGVGGADSALVKAELFDEWGNRIQSLHTVVFSLINEAPEPEGSNFNHRGQVDSAQTSGGVAIVTLYSGSQIGGKLIRAHTWKDSARLDEISVTLSRLAVIHGPPDFIDIDIDRNGEDAGGGSWALDLSVRIYDEWRNPVTEDYPVIFSLNPQSAHVSDGQLIYNSINTFDTLTITASVNTEDGIVTGEVEDFVLPLQRGEMSLHIDPDNWMIDEGPDTCLINCLAVVKDGHGVLINNAPVLFSASRAHFFWKNWARNEWVLFGPGDPIRKYTGWRGPRYQNKHNDDDGEATVYLRGHEFDFFLDNVTPEMVVNITAEVQGYPDVSAEPQLLEITRHP